jgi:hypothetical protein
MHLSGKWVGRGGNLATLSDIFCLEVVGTSHFSQQVAKVQSTNHRPVLNDMNVGHNPFITDVLFGEGG